MLIHVIDPSLVLTDGWKTVLALGGAADEATAGPDFEAAGFAQGLRQEIADDPFFMPVVDQVTDEFSSHWFSVGSRICRAEAASGVAVQSGVINSITSSALTVATIGLDTTAAVLLAQRFVRDGYLMERIKTGGSAAVHLDFETFTPDCRLAIFRRPWGVSMEMMEGWVSLFPLPINNRNIWLNQLVNQGPHEDQFASTVLEAIRAFSAIGVKAHSTRG